MVRRIDQIDNSDIAYVRADTIESLMAERERLWEGFGAALCVHRQSHCRSGYDAEDGCDARQILPSPRRPCRWGGSEIVSDEKRAPVQGYSAGIPWSMHLRAYDAYCKQHREQQALIEGGCRGGFCTKELDEYIPGWRDELSQIMRLERENAQLRLDLERKQRALTELIACRDVRIAAERAAMVERCSKHLEALPDKRQASLGPRDGTAAYMEGYEDACGDCADELRALPKDANG